MLKKKRICRFCEEKIDYIDFKDDKRLSRFTTEQGKITRELALIPYISDLAK